MFYPYFCGIVVAALVCFFAFPSELIAPAQPQAREPAALTALIPPPAPPPLPESLPIPALWDIIGERNGIPEFYRNGGTRQEVLAFFGKLLRSDALAGAVLDNAEVFNIAPSLAVSLCWAESRFNAQAVNRKNLNGTVDRGLFQLNSSTFPDLSEQDFFNPHINSYYGLSHLRWCLDSGGSVVVGLAMYNAGTNRVHSGGAPRKTLDYIAGILAIQEQVERLFDSYRDELERRRAIAAVPVPEPEPELELPKQPQQRLALLRPIIWGR